MFSISIFDRGIVSRGSWRIKTWFIVCFESLFGGPCELILSVRFYFSIKKNRSVSYDFCLIGFCLVLFLINDEYGIGLKLDFPTRSTSQ